MRIDLRALVRRLAAILLARWSACWRSRRWSPRCCCGSSGVRPAVAAETGVLMASPSETTLIVLGAGGQRRDDQPRHRQLSGDRHRDRPDRHAAARRASGARSARRGRDRGRAVDATLSRARTAPSSSVSAASGGWSPTCSIAHDKPYLAIDSDVDGGRRARAKRVIDVLFGDVARPELADRLAARPAARTRPDDGRSGAGRADRAHACAAGIPSSRSSPAPATRPMRPSSTGPA